MGNSNDHGTAVAIYSTQTDAEAAVKKLEAGGIDLKLLSIIGKDYRAEGVTVSTGLTPVGSALFAMGISRSRVINCESALNANKFLLIVHGANGHTSRVNEILRTTEPIELARAEVPSAR